MTSGQKHKKLGVCPIEIWKKRVLFFLIRLSLCGHFSKVFFEFVTVLLLFFVFWPQGMWDLRSLTRQQTHIPWVGRGSLNHWSIKEVPGGRFYRWTERCIGPGAEPGLVVLEEQKGGSSGWNRVKQSGQDCWWMDVGVWGKEKMQGQPHILTWSPGSLGLPFRETGRAARGASWEEGKVMSARMDFGGLWDPYAKMSKGSRIYKPFSNPQQQTPKTSSDLLEMTGIAETLAAFVVGIKLV